MPRTGGNIFRSHVFFTGLRGGMQASNFSEELQQAGLRTPAKTNYIYDTSYSIGGPIKRDRIWFYFLGYYRGSENTIPGMFYNRNEWDPTKWGYSPDESRPALSGGRGPLQPALRLTFQLSSRDKLNVFWDEQISNNSLGAGSATNAPETGGRNHGWQRVQQVKWTSTATNRLLLDAGLGTYLSNWNTRERWAEDSPLSVDQRRLLIQVNEQCAATQPRDAFGRGGSCADNGGIAGLNYRNLAPWNADWIGPHTWNAAATYVSGANSIKIARMRNGVQLQAVTTTGQRVTDYCDVRGKIPEQTGGFSTGSEVAGYSPVNPFCHVEPGITTRFTSAGSYIVPKVDVMVSATFQSSPAEPLQANWTVSSAIVAQTLVVLCQLARRT